MKAFVGVTDGNWHRFLAARPHLDEVNFWRPSGGGFHALQIGEPFLFKSKYPQNRIVGGGFFSGATKLPISRAWQILGEANGMASLEEMRSSIARYRRLPLGPNDDPDIGCIFVRDVKFFTDGATADPPPDFSSNLTQGKTYDLSTGGYREYFDMLLGWLTGTAVEVDQSEPWHRPGPVYSDPRLSRQRLGQGSFQVAVIEAYQRRCAVTGSRLLPTLQAAHIRSLNKGGEHRIDNGILLRADVHILFDRGYLAISPKKRLMVSTRLREEFGNGTYFYTMEGKSIALPERQVDQPSNKFLEWHLDTVFKA
ncbi:HNH endonuclease [Solwaraspora sp. WMMD1047]|uniref:HNH endonuclease n=1 Tax=Solwaraspora sp. WMMD1047 TaxID=3016102 RepID=UPI002417669E|nr:HNH endonuclease [Solwaraspora sp. WMMD1047]MDG4828137.1 HNH endonuclease [Solwaraspora sp. WMMD1047]